MSFPVGEIESHADTCAEEKFGSIDENHYNDLMNFFDVDLYEQHIDPMEPAIIDIDCGDEDNPCSIASDTQAPGNHKLKIKEAITKLNQLVPDEHSRYHIRRKTIFDDYISARERCKWLKPENRMNVTFIGEPGIDSGGPKREFLTGTIAKYLNVESLSLIFELISTFASFNGLAIYFIAIGHAGKETSRLLWPQNRLKILKKT